MSDYSKSTNFTTKDTLPTGNAGKIVKGTELDIEFTAISSAISSKADVSSPSFLGTPTAPTATFGANTTQIATTAFVVAALSLIYPVGSIYINASVSTNPSTLLGFGTWSEFGVGKVVIGLDSSDALFDTLEKTGGSKNAVVVSHTHTGTTSAYTHNHYVSTGGNADGGPYMGNYNPANADNFKPSLSGSSSYPNDKISSDNTHSHTMTTDATGSSGTNANVQPYVVVKMWKRTA